LGGCIPETLTFSGIVFRVSRDGESRIESILICRYFEHNVIEDGWAEFTVAVSIRKRLTVARDRRDALPLVQTEA
jgi:hypothetical protein